MIGSLGGKDASRPRGNPMGVLALCWGTYAAYYLGRVNLAVALPAIQDEFGWSRAAVGLIGAALYWTYAAGQLVNGHLGDRISPADGDAGARPLPCSISSLADSLCWGRWWWYGRSTAGPNRLDGAHAQNPLAPVHSCRRVG